MCSFSCKAGVILHIHSLSPASNFPLYPELLLLCWEATVGTGCVGAFPGMKEPFAFPIYTVGQL